MNDRKSNSSIGKVIGEEVFKEEFPRRKKTKHVSREEKARKKERRCFSSLILEFIQSSRDFFFAQRSLFWWLLSLHAFGGCTYTPKTAKALYETREKKKKKKYNKQTRYIRRHLSLLHHRDFFLSRTREEKRILSLLSFLCMRACSTSPRKARDLSVSLFLLFLFLLLVVFSRGRESGREREIGSSSFRSWILTTKELAESILHFLEKYARLGGGSFLLGEVFLSRDCYHPCLSLLLLESKGVAKKLEISFVFSSSRYPFFLFLSLVRRGVDSLESAFRFLSLRIVFFGFLYVEKTSSSSE